MAPIGYGMKKPVLNTIFKDGRRFKPTKKLDSDNGGYAYACD
jgi:hypothetical protein